MLESDDRQLAKRRPAGDPRRCLEQQTGKLAIIEPEQEHRRQQERQHRLSSRPVRPPGNSAGPEPFYPRIERVWQAGVHESVSRLAATGEAE